jgi:putative membrane protein
MKRFDSAIIKQITAGVTAAEGVSTLEIVVRVVARSGSYRDLAWKAASVVGLAALAALLYLPFNFRDVFVLPNVLIIAAAGGWIIGKCDPVLRALAGKKRCRAQVELYARDGFMDHSVSATRERTGVLVYVSMFEDDVLVIPDFGADGAAPEAEWHQVIDVGHDVTKPIEQRTLAVLDALKVLGQGHLPATGDNPNELPNEPVIG